MVFSISNESLVCDIGNDFCLSKIKCSDSDGSSSGYKFSEVNDSCPSEFGYEPKPTA